MNEIVKDGQVPPLLVGGEDWRFRDPGWQDRCAERFRLSVVDLRGIAF